MLIVVVSTVLVGLGSLVFLLPIAGIGFRGGERE